MAANLAMALDEIIKQGKGTRAGGGGRRGAGLRRSLGLATTTSARTRFPQRGFVSGEVPAGRWKHDKFMEVYGGNKKRIARGVGSSPLKTAKSSGSIGARIANKSGSSSGMVKMQISNLPNSVVTSDLEELFQDFEVYGVVVHYDEMGTHLGTADIYTDQQSASNILVEFKNIAIDGQEIKFCLVTESGKASIRDRLQRVSDGTNPIRKRGPIRKRISGGPIKRLSRATGKRRGGGVAVNTSKAADRAKVKTAEELDQELEAYMKKL